MRSVTVGALIVSLVALSLHAASSLGGSVAGVAAHVAPPPPRIAAAQTPVASWTLLAGPAPGLAGEGFVYDAVTARFVLFGGALNGTTLSGSTWSYNGATDTWTDVSPGFAPSPREGVGMVFDSAAGRVVLYGGMTANGMSGETWIYDEVNGTWTQMAPASTPGPREWPAMAYDSAADRAILYGGIGPSGPASDTWSYDFRRDTWTPLNATGPNAAYMASMAYDPLVDRIILFGGASLSGSTPDWHSATWSLDVTNSTWTQMVTADGDDNPPGRGGAAIAFDSNDGRVILFGGQGDVDGAPVFYNDTWGFDAAADAWLNLTPAGGPGARILSGMGFDPLAGLAVLAGGAVPGSQPAADAWSFQDGATHPSEPLNVAAAAGHDQVTLAWESPFWNGDAPVTNYTVYRGSTPGSEAPLATLGNTSVFTDVSVTDGTTYYYQVTAQNFVGESPRSNEVNGTPTSGLPPPPGPDTIPPQIAIASPSNDSVVLDTQVTVTGVASDNVAVRSVELTTDGSTWVLATGTASWSANVTLSRGANTVYARAMDTSGNTHLASVVVLVEDPGPPPLTYEVALVEGTLVGLVVSSAAITLFVRHDERKWDPPRRRSPSRVPRQERAA